MRTWVLSGSAALVGAFFVVVLHVADSRGADASALSDGAQLIAAVLASVSCAVAARRTGGRGGRAWWWVSAGTGYWAAGQGVWSTYEVVLGRAVPFPSLADVGFLAFPVVAGIGLVLWPAKHSHHATTRGRDVMDGAIIAVSLLVLSWVTVMAPVVQATDVSGASLALSLAYPAGDVVLTTLVLILLSRAETDRLVLGLLALGLVGFALADSLFSYLTSTGAYTSANLVSSGGWVTGFLFVAASASTASAGRRPATQSRPVAHRSSLVWMALPYVPLSGGGLALFLDMLKPGSATLVDLLLGTLMVQMVLIRQFLAMADNQRLLKALGDAGAKLEHIATHDALTGLPNRVLFSERLDDALASGSPSVLFCDLDNFKPVNDELGHAAGDRLLQLVADRLLTCVRNHDTVARLGGDEFAIVLVDCPDPRMVADRVVDWINQDTMVMGRVIRPSISVGMAQHPAGARAAGTPARAAEDRKAAAGRLLVTADAAMYAAKSAGKGRVVALDLAPAV